MHGVCCATSAGVDSVNGDKRGKNGPAGGGCCRTVIRSTTGFVGDVDLEGPPSGCVLFVVYFDGHASESVPSRVDLDDFSQLSRSPLRFLFLAGVLTVPFASGPELMIRAAALASPSLLTKASRITAELGVDPLSRLDTSAISVSVS